MHNSIEDARSHEVMEKTVCKTLVEIQTNKDLSMPMHDMTT